MQKIEQDVTLVNEVSVHYGNFRRDTLISGTSVFGIIALVGYIIQQDWLFSIGAGTVAMLIFSHEAVITKQLFKLSFDDKEQNVKLSYSWFMVTRTIEVSYSDLSYKIKNSHKHRKYQSAGQLVIYNQGRPLFRTGLDKYGWTNGLVQEATKSLRYRNIKFIK